MKRVGLLFFCVVFLCYSLTGCKSSDYRDACSYQETGAYEAALEGFTALGEYKDSRERAQQCSNVISYQHAVSLQEAKEYAEAAELFEGISGYEDSDSRAEQCRMWAEAIQSYDAAYSELRAENDTLQAAIDAGETLLKQDAPALDNALYDELSSAVESARNEFVELIGLPDTPEAALEAATAMAAANYDGLDAAITDACAELESSIQLYDLVNAPSDERVKTCLEQIPSVLQCVSVTEETDNNNLLNKDGSYIGRIVFACEPMITSAVSDSTLLNKGTDAGGSIEVFRNQEDAEKRNSYLAVFDGSILDSGSHIVLGTLVVRTSCKLTASQQDELEAAIIQALLTP